MAIQAVTPPSSIIDYYANRNLLNRANGCRIIHATSNGGGPIYASNNSVDGDKVIDNGTPFWDYATSWRVQGSINTNDSTTDLGKSSLANATTMSISSGVPIRVIYDPRAVQNERYLFTINKFSIASASSDGDVGDWELWASQDEDAKYNPTHSSWTKVTFGRCIEDAVLYTTSVNVTFRFLMVKAWPRSGSTKNYVELLVVKAFITSVPRLPKFISLTQDQKVKKGSPLTLSYSSINATSYNIEYSSDGGDIWTRLYTGTTNTSISYIPDSVTNNAIFRVQGVNDTLVSEWAYSPSLIISNPAIISDSLANPSSTHKSDIKVSAIIKDLDGGGVQYRIRLGSEPLYPTNGFTPLSSSPLIIDYTILNNLLTLGDNTVYIDYQDVNGLGGTETLLITKTDTAPVVKLMLTREVILNNATLSGFITDKDGDKISYRVLVNGVETVPWTFAVNDPKIHYLISNKLLTAGESTEISVEYLNDFDSTLYNWTGSVYRYPIQSAVITIDKTIGEVHKGEPYVFPFSIIAPYVKDYVAEEKVQDEGNLEDGNLFSVLLNTRKFNKISKIEVE